MIFLKILKAIREFEELEELEEFPNEEYSSVKSYIEAKKLND